MKTPQTEVPALARALGLTIPVYLKREDLHQYGSHKGRSIPLMIKTYAKDGIREFVISSSGNAALAAIRIIAQHNKNNPSKKINLTIFVGKNILNDKLNTLEQDVRSLKSEVQLIQVPRPKQTALQYEKEHGAKLLRQSTDDLALAGYKELADELNKIKNLQAIFIPASSGTTAQAMGEAFQTLGQDPQIHIVQSQACHPIVDYVRNTKETLSISPSIASAIVDRVAHRKEAVANIIVRSKGGAWMVSDDEIREAIKLVKQTTSVNISPNSALSIAGLKKAVVSGFSFSAPVVCLVTGP